MNIVIHSKTDCPYCKAAKNYLTSNGVPFREMIYNDNDRRQALYDELGLAGAARTVPQIVVDGVRIGGFNALMASDVVARHRAGTFDAEF